MNFTKLRHIVAVEQCGSITKAAQMLNLTQSTVTKSVADVEQGVGFALFDRRSRGVTVTEEGREFLSRAARIISDIDQLLDDAQSRRQEKEAVFRIGVSPPSIQGLLNRAVRRLIARNPQLRLHLTAMPLERGIRLLRRGDIDVLIGPEQDLSRETDFKCEALAPIKAALFVRKGHPLTDQDEIRPEDLLRYPVISPDLSGPYADRLFDLLSSGDADPRRRLHIIEYFPTIRDTVASTDIVAIVGAGYANTEAFHRQFTLLDIQLFDQLPLGYAYRGRWLPSRATLAFLSALRAHPPGEDVVDAGPEQTVSHA